MLQHTASCCNTHLYQEDGYDPSEDADLNAATHCNTLQHAATHCNTLQHTATHCIMLQHTASHCNTHSYQEDGYDPPEDADLNAATHCNTLQHAATHCNTLQYAATHCNSLYHAATHCITLQHTFISGGWVRSARRCGF